MNVEFFPDSSKLLEPDLQDARPESFVATYLLRLLDFEMIFWVALQEALCPFFSNLLRNSVGVGMALGKNPVCTSLDHLRAQRESSVVQSVDMDTEPSFFDETVFHAIDLARKKRATSFQPRSKGGVRNIVLPCCCSDRKNATILKILDSILYILVVLCSRAFLLHWRHGKDGDGELLQAQILLRKNFLFEANFYFQKCETTVWVSLTVWVSGTYLSK